MNDLAQRATTLLARRQRWIAETLALFNDVVAGSAGIGISRHGTGSALSVNIRTLETHMRPDPNTIGAGARPKTMSSRSLAAALLGQICRRSSADCDLCRKAPCRPNF